MLQAMPCSVSILLCRFSAFFSVPNTCSRCSSLHARKKPVSQATYRILAAYSTARRCAVRRKNHCSIASVLAPCLCAGQARSRSRCDYCPQSASRGARENTCLWGVCVLRLRGPRGVTVGDNVWSDREDGGNRNLVGTLKQKGQAFS